MSSDKLDLASPSFDAKEVLMSPEVVLPYPNAKIYSNLAEFEMRVLKGKKPIRKNVTSKISPLVPEEDKSTCSTVSNISGNQPPVPTSSKPEKQNVLNRMKTAFNKGPLNLLNKCVQQRIRVKVSIRNYGDIRGTCTGFILAFDKHWNLAMRDVDETYIKRKTLKTPVLKMLPNECYRTVTVHESSEVTIAQVSFSADSLKEIELGESDALNTSSLKSLPTKKIQKIPQECTKSGELSIIETSDLLQESITRLNLEVEFPNKTDEKDTNTKSVGLERGEDTPVIPVTEVDEPAAGSQATLTRHRKKKKQSEICQRHVNQLFIRGDNVVFIRLLS